MHLPHVSTEDANKSNNPLNPAIGANVQNLYTPKLYDSDQHMNDLLLRGTLPLPRGKTIKPPPLVRLTVPTSTRPDPSGGHDRTWRYQRVRHPSRQDSISRSDTSKESAMKIDTKSRPLLCSVAAAAQTQARPPAAKPATEVTKQANAAGQRQLNFADKQDFEAAKRGLIGRLDPFTTRNARDHVVWEKK